MKEMGKKEYIPWTPEEGFDLSFLFENNLMKSRRVRRIKQVEGGERNG